MQRFLDKILKDPKTGCWNWQGSKNQKRGAYGRFRVDGKCWLAHRFSYFLFKGDPEGKYVCHHCDNPSCVNPEHLFLGTQRDNMRDMTEKGRADNAGERNGRTKLTQVDVDDMRWLSGMGVKTSRLANEFDVSWLAAHRIVTNRTWN